MIFSIVLYVIHGSTKHYVFLTLFILIPENDKENFGIYLPDNRYHRLTRVPLKMWPIQLLLSIFTTDNKRSFTHGNMTRKALLSFFNMAVFKKYHLTRIIINPSHLAGVNENTRILF